MTFHVYQDAALGWRWRLVAANGRIVADSGEAYTREHDVRRAISHFKRWAYVAPVEAV